MLAKLGLKYGNALDCGGDEGHNNMTTMVANGVQQGRMIVFHIGRREGEEEEEERKEKEEEQKIEVARKPWAITCIM